MSRIDLYVHLNGSSGGGNAENNVQPKTKQTSKDDEVLTVGAFNAKTGKAIGAMVAHNAAQYVGGHISTWTGNSQTGATFQVASSAVGYGIAFMANPYLAAASLALSITTNVINKEYELAWERKEAEVYRQRSGNYLSNKGR